MTLSITILSKIALSKTTLSKMTLGLTILKHIDIKRNKTQTIQSIMTLIMMKLVMMTF